ncbi:hypothetical protein ON010_g12896 [Phytophthora cinnamomi]|nr:hypothetical protein ON010_g12896 [Phytophthora cinnamomi]
MVRPLFQRESLPSRQVEQGGEFYRYEARTPPDSDLVEEPPRRYPTEPSVLPTKSRMAPVQVPAHAFLAEGIQVALRYSTSGSNPGDNLVGTRYASLDNFPAPDSDISVSYKSTAAQSRLKDNRRREQCRINQARYRLRQDRKVQLLNDTVVELREEIPLLELQRDRILFGTKQSVFNVVVEYFHLFRHGIRMTNRAHDALAQQQQVFLRSVMTPRVILGERQGVHALIEQWRRYSSYFEDLHFQLEHMDERVKDLVTVSASMSVTITDATLKHVFPHLVHANLGDTLLGRRLMLPCSLHFEWDDTSSHVMRLEMTVDFLTPVNRMLNSLSDTAFVLGQALITLDGSIGKFDTWE